MIPRLIARFPTAVASAIYFVVALLAYAPLLAGKVLLSNDQATGYSFRAFAAEYVRANGAVPGWYPHLFGGMPFAANTAHGDTFFPTALLRLVFPVDVGMALGFFIFTVLAGIFAFIFLRGIGLGWAAAFAGGAGYMFSGQIISMASPGHDGKLFVSALMPLALFFLYRATAFSDWRHYVYFGVTVGFSLLTPHFQMTYYLLMAAGFFWLYMVFFSDQKAAAQPWWRAALLFAGALLVGFGIAAIQLAPFLDYMPWSPRGAAGSSSTGWAYATAWSMPPEEILGTVWPAFSGMLSDYWGRNPFKLHSEYGGATVALLALLSFRLLSYRRMAWFFVFLAIYGALFSFGGHTPFYRIPYEILPYLKSTRAVGMAYFLTTFSVCVLAAFGVQWLASRATVIKTSGKQQKVTLSERSLLGLPRPLAIGVLVLAAFALLALTGAWRPVMHGLADPQKYGNVDQNYPRFILDALRVLVFGIAVAALAMPSVRRRWSAEVWGLLLGAVVMLDLYSVERRYLPFSPRAAVEMAPDEVVAALKRDTSLYRVIPNHTAYTHNYLMVHGIRSVVGYNGQELHRYDELLGGKNVFSNLPSQSLWKMLGIRYLILADSVEVPVLERVSGRLRTYRGDYAYLYRFRDAAPYAFLVRDAVRVNQPEAAVIRSLVDPAFDPRRLVVLPGDAVAGRDAINQLSAPVTTPVSVREPHAGRLEFRIASPTPDSTYLFVSENYFPDWQATVDGRPAPVLRAQVSLMAVALPPGAQQVVLEFEPRAYYVGRTITLVSVLGVILLAIGSAVVSRRRRREALPVPAGAAA